MITDDEVVLLARDDFSRCNRCRALTWNTDEDRAEHERTMHRGR